MTPHYSDPFLDLYLGDARDVLSQMPAETVHCAMTSPPFPEYAQQALDRIAEGRCKGEGAPLDMARPIPSGSLWEESA